MLPLEFFSSRTFSAGNTAVFLTFASLFAVVFFSAQLLQIVLGHSPLEAGLLLLPWTPGFMVIAPMAGALADRIGERPLIAGGLALQAGGCAWLAVIGSTTVTYGQVASRLQRGRSWSPNPPEPARGSRVSCHEGGLSLRDPRLLGAGVRPRSAIIEA